LDFVILSSLGTSSFVISTALCQNSAAVSERATSMQVKCKCGQVFSVATGKDAVCPACGRKGQIKAAATYDVFVSHASEDHKTAEAACANLESKGLRCWIAPRDITPGAEWSEAIIDAIDRSRSLLLVLTTHSNSSPQVLREVQHAVERKLPILPLRLDDVAISKSLSYFVSAHHWLDAFNAPLDQHLPTVTASIQKLLSGKAVLGVASPTANQSPGRPPHTRRLWLGAAAVLAILVVSAAVWSLWGKKPEPQKATDAGQKVSEPPPFKDPLLPEYVTMMRRRFNQLDSDKNGRLGPGEYRVLPGNAAVTRKLQLFNVFDQNHDGAIDMTEWYDNCRLAILNHDKDGDHRLSKEEFMDENASPPPLHANPSRRPLPFEKYDFDGDGYVTLDELEKGWALYHID